MATKEPSYPFIGLLHCHSIQPRRHYATIFRAYGRNEVGFDICCELILVS